MSISQATWRWTALIGLWAAVCAIGWLMAIQAFMVLLHSLGTWHRPGITQVQVLRVDQDENSSFTDYVLVKVGEEERTLCMLKKEAAELRADEEVWVLNNYYATPLRPAQFRLTPLRLLVEYPEPLLILALLGIWRVRRAQARAAKIVSNQPRKPLQDDFHMRAQRFGAPKPPGSE